MGRGHVFQSCEQDPEALTEPVQFFTQVTGGFVGSLLWAVFQKDVCIVTLPVSVQLRVLDGHPTTLCFGHMASYCLFLWAARPTVFERSYWAANRVSVTDNWPEVTWGSAALGQSRVVFCCSNQTTVLINISLQHF